MCNCQIVYLLYVIFGIFILKFVDAIVQTKETVKPIERLANTENKALAEDFLTNPRFATRVKIAKRAAQEISPNTYINLGIGIPTLAPMFIPEDYNIVMQGENGILGLTGYPEKGEEDPDLVDPGKETVKVHYFHLIFQHISTES